MPSENLPRSFLRKLSLHGALNPFLKSLAEELFVSGFSLSPENQGVLQREGLVQEFLEEHGVTDQESLDQWRKKNLIDSPAQLVSYVRFKSKRELIINELLSENGETAYLRFKDRLDRVLYSVIRVTSEELAYHLYYSIDNGEISFSKAAEIHSQGVESRSAGIIGPVDLTTPHPEIAARLKRGQPGDLFEPFKADNWYIVLSLLYRFEASFDDITKRSLGQLLFSSKVSELIPAVSKEIFSHNDQ